MLSISNHLILSAIWDKSAHLHEYYYHNNYPATAQTKRQMRTIGASCFRDSSQVIYMNKLEHELSISLDVWQISPVVNMLALVETSAAKEVPAQHIGGCLKKNNCDGGNHS